MLEISPTGGRGANFREFFFVVVNIELPETLNMVRPEMTRRKTVSAQPEKVIPAAGPNDFKELYDRHSRMILRTAWRITGRAEDAEDVLQQVFLRLLRGRSRNHPGKITGGYLRRAALNASLDLVRARGTHPEETLTPESATLRKLAGGDNPEQNLRGSDFADALIEAVSRLNERAAEVFVLRDIEGLNNNEIAEVLGTTPNTVTVTYHRARTRLLELLSGWEGLAPRSR